MVYTWNTFPTGITVHELFGLKNIIIILKFSNILRLLRLSLFYVDLI